MAKGQKRSNKEIKKPKSAKSAAPDTAPTLLTKKIAAGTGSPKKKG